MQSFMSKYIKTLEKQIDILENIETDDIGKRIEIAETIRALVASIGDIPKDINFN